MSVVAVNAINPEPAIIERAVQVLRSGGLVAFPTETVYGLGANALDAVAVARIFEAKARPAWNPIIAHVASAADAQALTTAWPASASLLADAFWPGPLTLVLPKHAIVPDIISGGLPAVAVRVPSHPVAHALISAAGFPIAAPSANRFTELSPTTAQHVQQGLGDRVELILDGGPSDVGIESTVVDLTGDVPIVLRPGVITRDAIARVVGHHVELATARIADNTPRLSPGMVERHYAPRADVWLFGPSDADAVRTAATERVSRQAAGGVAALVLDWSLEFPANVHVVRMPNSPLAYARMLYATLHELDAMGHAIVAIERPPQSDAWDGIHDRLSRAAH